VENSGITEWRLRYTQGLELVRISCLQKSWSSIYSIYLFARRHVKTTLNCCLELSKCDISRQLKSRSATFAVDSYN
jgi:hypothetical protein